MTTWNPIEKGSVTTLSNGNLTANNILQNSSVKSTDPKSSGKWFCEIKVDALNINCIGIGSSDLLMTSGITSSNNFFYYYFDGRKSNGGLTSTYASTLSVGDIIGILIDFDAGTLTYYKNGVNLGIAFDNIKKLSNFCIVVSSGTLSGNGGVTANFGATPFKYLPNSNDLPFGVKSYDGSQTLSHESKSFIYHDYQYKKFIPKVNSQPKDTNLVPIMTSNTSPIGKVSANSESDPAWGAFDDEIKSRSFWYSADNNNSNNQWLQYEFEESKIVNRISLQSSIAISGINYGIKNFTILGSNDGVSYYTLFNGIHPNNSNEVFYTFTNNNSYKIYRIKGNSYHSDSQMLISSFKMFGDEVLGALAHWKTISSTLPSSTSFLEQGMNNLPSTLNRRVQSLEPIQMNKKEDVLEVSGVGFVFSKTINLNKYIDLRKINIEVR